MPSPLTNVLAFASIPVAAVVVGGVAGAFRTPSPAVRSGVQHIAVGVLFAALATELLPDVIHGRMPLVSLIGFALGVAAMLLLKRLAPEAGEPGGHRRRQPPVAAAALDGFWRALSLTN